MPIPAPALGVVATPGPGLPTAEQGTADGRRDRADDRERDVMIEAGQVDPGGAGGDRDGGPA